MTEFGDITTDNAVQTYQTATGIFVALLNEIRELSKKKPDATLSGSKVQLINAVLADLLTVFQDEPEGKYLCQLESDALPQASDALLMMVQFQAASAAFKQRYYVRLRSGRYFEYLYLESDWYWITEEQISEWQDKAELARAKQGEDD